MSSVSARRHEVVDMRLRAAAEPVSPTARVNVVFIEPGGRERRVPAYVSRGEWRVRYSSSVAGEHRYRVNDDHNLATRAGAVHIELGDGSHALSAHGPLQPR